MPPANSKVIGAELAGAAGMALKANAVVQAKGDFNSMIDLSQRHQEWTHSFASENPCVRRFMTICDSLVAFTHFAGHCYTMRTHHAEHLAGPGHPHR
jgi:hypothetical protein